ncbi:MAG: FAD-binding protein [Dehalococcoidia bacterium]|nr:FAD-binding protein [Dehalococcoidia bacterium]
MRQHDVIVIGGGLAGMRAAQQAQAMGADVAMISKIFPTRSHSAAAQGGINAAVGVGDSWEDHAYDTVKGSDYLGDQDAIEVLCEEGPADIIALERMGVIFNRNGEGQIDMRAFGGATNVRTCYVADQTGQVILHVMWEQLLKSGLTVYSERFVTELLQEDGRISGCVALEIPTGRIEIFQTRAIVLATGGIGQVYYPTTNGLAVTGDGLALAYRAGASLMDMEMIQHHPTTLKANGVLITEGARGEGAYLLNSVGERFMENYAPNMKELASRDVVSRAETMEVRAGRAVDGDCVLLDLRHLGRDLVMTKLTQIFELARDYAGTNVLEEPLPIRPGHHYIMGGIKTDVDGRTWDPSGQGRWKGAEGLFAAGETANVSVHGGNRLGGNSLLDTVVFGRRSGAGAVEYARSVGWASVNENAAINGLESRIKDIFSRPSDGLRAATLRRQMGTAMNDGIAVFRNEEGMQKTLATIRAIKERLPEVSVHNKGRLFNTDLLSVLELDYMLDVAESVGMGAVTRKESRGAHAREDFPDRNDEDWLKHIVVARSEDGQAEVGFLPVTMTKWEPIARTY